MPSSKGMLNRTGKPTRLRSCRETEQDRIRSKMRVRRPWPCSGISRTQRGLRPIATSAVIIATKSGSYDWSNGRFRKDTAPPEFLPGPHAVRKALNLYTGSTKSAKHVAHLSPADAKCPSDLRSGRRADHVHMAVATTLRVGSCRAKAICHPAARPFERRSHSPQDTRYQGISQDFPASEFFPEDSLFSRSSCLTGQGKRRKADSGQRKDDVNRE
jgi:hypothetical protein